LTLCLHIANYVPAVYTTYVTISLNSLTLEKRSQNIKSVLFEQTACNLNYIKRVILILYLCNMSNEILQKWNKICLSSPTSRKSLQREIYSSYSNNSQHIKKQHGRKQADNVQVCNKLCGPPKDRIRKRCLTFYIHMVTICNSCFNNQ
jgi:uncharacterized membrane protein